MEQLEKVVKGLECCVLRDPDDHLRCGECPYNPHAISNEPCANGLKFNALALIRQQQERIKEFEAGQTARVMTLEEVKQAKGRDVWLELSGNIADDVLTAATIDGCGTKGISTRYESLSYTQYGVKPYGWRCWDSRPTYEQREAVAWE